MVRGFLLALVGAAWFAAPATADDAVDKAKEAVVRKLKDPASAQFADVRRATDPDMVCGRVNAKNNMGGYEGAREFRYVVSRNTAVIVDGFPMTGDMLDSLAQPGPGLCR